LVGRRAGGKEPDPLFNLAGADELRSYLNQTKDALRVACRQELYALRLLLILWKNKTIQFIFDNLRLTEYGSDYPGGMLGMSVYRDNPDN